jgi:lysyl-tRNA synthetase class 2
VLLWYPLLMPEPLENLRQIRLGKLRDLRELGVDPFPAGWDKLDDRIKNEELVEMELGAVVVAAGRIRGWREHGSIIFADLEDGSGRVQVVFKKENLGEKEWEVIELLDMGDFLGVEGPLFKTRAGELSIEVVGFKLLTKSVRPLPSKWHGLKNVEERYRKRYLDLLMNPEVKEVFEKRVRILSLLREYLDKHGFVEVETPILQPQYGGASARPFVTHLNALDTDFYLRISDELYLKRLIVGGFEKVYEVSKDFRNEGIDRQHSPEFTQIEFYWAYADYEELMRFTEEMLSSVIKEVVGDLEIEFEGNILNFSAPWPRITYRELVLKYTGIDVDQVATEEELLTALENQGLTVDLEGAVGYGAVLDSLYKECCRPRLIQPTFLIDHPAETVALAKRKKDDPSKIARFQLLAAGYELVNAYNELNDPQDQKERWEEQEGLAERGLAEHEALDYDYIEALEYGMPPTAGWGMGIDRLTAILTGQHSIRDVILFPLMRPDR